MLGSKMEQGGEGLFAKREVEHSSKHIAFLSFGKFTFQSLFQVEQGDLVAFYGGLQVVHTNYASDYKIRLNDDTDIDIPQVGVIYISFAIS